MSGLVSVLFVIHGLFHLLGVVHWWGLADLPMSGRTLLPADWAFDQVFGLLWLVVTLALVVAAARRVLGRESWWVAGAAGLLLSQVLIVIQWDDAGVGTVPNVLLALVVVVGAGTARFHDAGRVQARQLLASASPAAVSELRPEDVTHLPAPVQRWLHRSGAVGRPRARTVRLRQGGGMRTAPDQAYMPVVAEQYFTVERPGFVWMVDVTMARVLPVVGRDAYVDGHGRMLIRAAGLVTVADGRGPTFDQGTALRYLGEIIWFPSAAVSPHIQWQGIDDQHAAATLNWEGQQVSATFGFDAEGRVTSLDARRFYNGERLEAWSIPMTAWARIRDVEIPVRGGAVWKLAAGDFDYFQWEILDVEVNQPSLWDAP